MSVHIFPVKKKLNFWSLYLMDLWGFCGESLMNFKQKKINKKDCYI